MGEDCLIQTRDYLLDIFEDCHFYKPGPVDSAEKTSKLRLDDQVVTAQNENWRPVILNMSVLVIDCY